MKKYIHVTKEVREHLMNNFGVTNVMVWYALTFHPNRGNSDLAKRIRMFALQKGGIVMVVSPEKETLHDSDDYMRQYLPNDVMLEFSKKEDAGCDVYHKGVKVRHYDKVMVSDIPEIQNWAATLR
ncbi:MAG: hypothetical protein UHP25_02730 [Prevotella sp.]|nr:hypothetical protein [Prevotella sp.]